MFAGCYILYDAAFGPIFVKLVCSSSRVLGHDLSARWGSFDSKFCLCTQWYQRDIISLYWNEFDSVSSLVAHSKQTQQAFGLAYWRPMGVGLWAKMKICTVWFWGKMSSTLSLFLPVLCFFQCSVFVPCSLVSCVLRLQGFVQSGWVIGAETFAVCFYGFV